MKVSSTQSTYNVSVGYNHNAVLTHLSPNTKYWYQIVNANQHHFKTGPSQSFQKPVVIPTFGDMGVLNSNTTIPHLIHYAKNENTDFFLHVGDISYADDYESDQFEGIWEEWFELMKPVLEISPYMTCAGNHEAVCGEKSCANYTGHFAPYLHRFRMPFKESLSPSNMYHSWNYGGIHFVAINTETDFPGSPEHKEGGFGDWVSWFEKDLSNVDRTITPWVVVFGHRPIYSTSKGFSDIFGYPMNHCAKLQAAVEEILHKHEVDIYICGHVHTYERSLPVYKATRIGNFPNHHLIENPKSTIHIVNGAAGCTEGLSNNKEDSWEPGSEKWSWYGYRFGTDFGYGVIHVFNGTHLYWEFRRSGDNGIQDHFWIVRSQ